MARRNPAASSSLTPAGHISSSAHNENEGWFSSFKRREWDSPERRASNISIATSLGLFFGSIAVIRTFGEAMAPA